PKTADATVGSLPGFHKPVINRTDPGYPDPVRYYDFGGDWSRSDSPGYTDRQTSFDKMCFTPGAKLQYVAERRARTAKTAEWMLHSACKALSGGKTNPFPGLLFATIDAAALWPTGKAYFFKGTQ